MTPLLHQRKKKFVGETELTHWDSILG